MREDMFKAIAVTLVISALLVVTFIFFMRYKIARQDVFTELYLNRPDNLPKKLKVNETYNLSFVVTNHELDETTYVYEVSSRIKNITKNITLVPGEKAVISLSVTPEDICWVLNFTSEQEFEDRLASMNGNFIAQDNDFRMIIANKSLKHFLPISHNLTGFGFVFHTNISTDELKEKPFNKILKEESIDKDSSTYKTQNITLFTKNDEIFVSVHQTANYTIIEKEQFSIELYKENTNTKEKQEVYFWYEVT